MGLDTKDKMTPPGTGKKEDGGRQSIKSVKPPKNPTIKGKGQWKIEHNKDSHRKTDMKLPKTSGQPPRFLEANNIMNNIKQVFQPAEGKVTDYIKKFDPKNSSGAIKNHLDIMDKLLKKGADSMSSMTGRLGGGMVQSIQQSKDQQKPPCPQGYRFDTKTEKCVLDCPIGQIWDENEQKCVPDEQGARHDTSEDDGFSSALL